MTKLILEAQSGPQSGKRIEVSSGQTSRVGRTARADHAFPKDTHMSGAHFAVECEGESFRISDLNSANGTLVNGQRIITAILRDGDQIIAGETRFRVRVEEDKPAAPAAAVAPVTHAAAVQAPAGPPQPADRLLAMLRGDFQPLYAILDTAREPDVLKSLVESKAECQSLFAGQEGAKLAHFAPYLVMLAEESPLLDVLVRKAWGKSWGIYLTCDRPFSAVRAHFRQLLMVNQPDGKQVYFRFYDPRVLRMYLPTCLPEEVAQFFGPVKYYLMEDENPDVLLRFSNAGRGAGLRKFQLMPETPVETGSQGARPAEHPATR